MLVYRVEHKVDGFGPYRPTGGDATHSRLSDVLCIKHADDDHPSPAEDPKLRSLLHNSFKYFGFASEEEARTWFAGFEENLDAAGYVISVYDVEECFCDIGDTQVLFLRNESDLVEQRRMVCDAAQSA